MAESSLEEKIEQIGTLHQLYRPINPSHDYKQEEFLYHQDTLNDLTKWREQIEKDPTNLKPREKLSKKVFGDKKYHVGLSDVEMKVHARAVQEDALEKMARYSAHNFDKLFNKLEEESVQAYLFSVPLYQTKDNKEHNTLVALIQETSAVQEIAKKKDIGQMRKYLLSAVKNDKSLPNYAKEIISYLANSDSVITRVFSMAADTKGKVLNMALTKNEKFDEDRARKLIKDSLQVAKDAFIEEEDEGARSDIWSDVIKPYYTKLAEIAYVDENLKYEKEHAKIDEKNKRETKRKQLRMAA